MSKEKQNTESSGKKALHIADVMERFSERGLCYAPKSIYHGTKITGILSIGKESIQAIEISRLTDFIEYLFDHSEHCDHISQPDAWMEFCKWEAKENSP